MILDNENNEVQMEFSLRIYPLEAIKAACYKFVDRCFVFLDRPAPRTIAITLNGKDALNETQLKALAGALSNELLHQTLRLQIGKKTGRLREMIVGRALLSAEPLTLPAMAEQDTEWQTDPQPDEPADYLEDPLGIAVPWEEKYGDAEPPAKKEPEKKE